MKQNYFSFVNLYSLPGDAGKKIRIYFTWQPKLTWVIYNGLLEPAVQKTIDNYQQDYEKDNAFPHLKRVLFDHAAAVYVRFRKIELGFVQNFYARELTTTFNQEVGTIYLSFKL